MDDRHTYESKSETDAAGERPQRLGALGDAILERAEWYCAQAAGLLQTSARTAPRWNALELLAMHVGVSLSRASIRRALRWVEREVREVPVDVVLDEVHAVCFAVLESVEDDPQLFSEALPVLSALQNDLNEAAEVQACLRRRAPAVPKGRSADDRRLRAAAI